MPALKRIGAAALSAFGFGQGASAITANYLIVAGGAGGGGAGGGGGGGYQANTTTLSLTTSYTIIVGAGGATAGAGANTFGFNGSNSSVTGLTQSAGGGGGGAYSNTGGTCAGLSGGSGGGGGNSAGGAGSLSGGSAVSGQGNAGGTGASNAGPYSSGGGGGAGAVGGSASGITSGNGGAGLSTTITGATLYFSGGGGGGAQGSGSTAGNGGIGGGGGGGNGYGGTAVGTGGGSSINSGGSGTYSATTGNGGNGGANSGGGGGGMGISVLTAGQGGSGVVIVSYLGAQQFGGGVVTSAAGNTIHTFYTSGVLSPLSSLSASYLIVAGGGGGGYDFAGGGGAGGLLSGSALTIDTNSTYLVAVGAGGTNGVSGTPHGSNGSNSTFSMVATTAVGGGGGGNPTNVNGYNGGSGGGGSYLNGTGGSASPAGQGNAGGTGAVGGSAGGGGAGAAGANGGGGAGGIGLTSSISGTSTYYAGGGGGGNSGAGGLGGGGAAGPNATAGTAGTANTGGGGGGGGGTGGNGGAGGSGIVIISYPYTTDTNMLNGGTMTIVGGNVIHTFTSSGYLSPLTNFGNSLRFRAANSAYLARTITAATNPAVWTMSFWVKRGTLGTTQEIITSSNGGPNQCGIEFTSGDQLRIINYISSSFATQYVTTQVFRDPAAWYHIVASQNSSTGFNLYVNGTRVTAFGTATGPNTADWLINQVGRTVNIGREQLGAVSYFDGYMTNINFVDGQALTANSFGSFNQYGNWVPVTYGGSYGTNGFFLPFNAGSSSYAGGFNGSSQYVAVAPNAALQMGTSDYTIECWAYFNSFSTNPVLYDSRYSGTSPGIQIYLPSGVPNIYGGAGTATLLITGSSALPTGRWVHIALVRASNVTTLYINGAQSGTSTTDSTNYNGTGGAIIGAIFNASGAFVNGYVSNFRMVKGTAVYTNNFTPSTTPLTAITNTQLLTLQNSTLVDNSTNAFTIVNGGSVTMSPDLPLSTGIFNDQSPQGNNWTPSGISGIPGSTLDYMTDVPTLSNATSSNYAVWNPLNSAFGLPPATLSNANLKAYTPDSSGRLTSTTICPASGKWYFETVFTFSSATGAFIGVRTLGSTFYYIIYQPSSATVNIDGTGATYGTTASSGDTIGVALDIGANTILFYKNNTQIGGTFSFNAGAVGQTFAPYCYNPTTGDTWELNCGQQPYKYTPPSGYLPLNAFNM